MKALSISVLVVLLFSYQNCSQKNFGNERMASNVKGVESAQSGNSSGSNSSIDLNSQNIEEFSFFATKSEVVSGRNQKTNPQFAIQQNKEYSLDLNSGEIIERNQYEEDEVGVRYCLTSDLKNDLETLLNSSQICKSSEASQELINQQDPSVCAQVVQDPYAIIKISNQDYKLGYASDACGKNRVDLCNEKSEQLKVWINLIVNQLDQLNCP